MFDFSKAAQDSSVHLLPKYLFSVSPKTPTTALSSPSPPRTAALPSPPHSPHLHHLHIHSGRTLLPLCSSMTAAGNDGGAAEMVDSLLLSLARGAGDRLAEKRAAVSGQRGRNQRGQGGGSK
ncbi:hypothetical protein Droror1_Dr00001159 [Drosera rotundifolia]